MNKGKTFGPLELAACTIGALVSQFLPWGQLQVTPTLSFGGTPFGGENPFGGMTMTATMTGWNGTFTVLGVSAPGWFTFVLAAAAASLSYLASLGSIRPARWLAPGLALVGVLQSLATFGMLATSPQSTPGIGPLCAAFCLFGLVVTTSRLGAAPGRQPS